MRSLSTIIVIALLASGNACQAQSQVSQTQSYLNTLGSTRQEQFDKIKKVLTAVNNETRSGTVTIEPEAFSALIDQAIKTEENHPGYFALYHSGTKEGIPLALLRTYIDQKERGWDRDDFFIIRPKSVFYERPAKTARDYFEQNLEFIQYQFMQHDKGYSTGCIDWGRDCKQFDFSEPWRNHLISCSQAFIASVDDTSRAQRDLNALEYTAWESSFYYFAVNMSWSNLIRLYDILINELKANYPRLFENNPINIAVKKYIASKYIKIVNHLLPHRAESLTPQEQLQAQAGLMFQFLIPKNIINNVAYLSWPNGALWQRKMNNISDGWDDNLGAYTQLGPILEIMRQNPLKLGRSLHVMQVRIILKDLKYFYEPTTPIKINLISSLSKSKLRVFTDYLKMIADVIVENNNALKNNRQQEWFETANIGNQVKKIDQEIQDLLRSNKDSNILQAINLLYYQAKIDADKEAAKSIAEKYKNSGNRSIKDMSEKILNS